MTSLTSGLLPTLLLIALPLSASSANANLCPYRGIRQPARRPRQRLPDRRQLPAERSAIGRGLHCRLWLVRRDRSGLQPRLDLRSQHQLRISVDLPTLVDLRVPDRNSSRRVFNWCVLGGVLHEQALLQPVSSIRSSSPASLSPAAWPSSGLSATPGYNPPPGYRPPSPGGARPAGGAPPASGGPPSAPAKPPPVARPVPQP